MRKNLKYAFAGIWVIAVSGLVGMLHAWHKADYSQNLALDALGHSYHELGTGQFGVIHFLAPTCSCSEIILETFEKSGPLSQEVIEEVHLVGEDLGWKDRLKELGFKVFHYRFSEFSKKFEGKISGLPLLTIYNDQKNTIYQGGYSDKSITPFTKIDIAQFLRTVKKGQQEKLPIIGCAVSKELQNKMDILGIKYSKGNE